MAFRESGVCRCCLAKGQFKTLTREYRWISGREMYGHMLTECFGLEISRNEMDEYLICEVCITRLRDATNFKKQVIESGDRLQQMVINKNVSEQHDERQFDVYTDEDEIFSPELSTRNQDNPETNIATDEVADDAASECGSSIVGRKKRKRAKTKTKSLKKDETFLSEVKVKVEETASEIHIDDDANDLVSQLDLSGIKFNKKSKKRAKTKATESTSKPSKKSK